MAKLWSISSLASVFRNLVHRCDLSYHEVESALENLSLVVRGFLPAKHDRSSWIRLDEDRGLLLLKTIGPRGEVEEQTEIPTAHAHVLLDVCVGEVDYIRTILPIGERHALVDEIIRHCVLHLVTMGFDTEEEARGFRYPRQSSIA